MHEQPAKKEVTSFDVEKLPSSPQVLLKLIDKCHQVDVDFNELASIILMDVVLTAKVIATAASPANARLKEPCDFSRLLAELGASTIRTIATTSAVHLFFSQRDKKTSHVLEQCWHRSLITAQIAKLLARQSGYSFEDDAYIAGLLHNIGQLLLLKNSPGSYLEATLDKHADKMEEGQRQFDGNAIEIGAELVGKWQFGSFLEDAVRFQHAATEAVLDAPHLIKLINFACKLSEQVQPMEQLANDGKQLFGLNRLQLVELLEQASNEVYQGGKQLGITFAATASESEAEKPLLNEQVNLELARKVRDIALLDSVCQHLSSGCDLESTLCIIRQDLNILFGLSHSLYFLYNEKDNRLVSRDSHKWKQDQFSIPLEQGRSLVVDSILGQSLSFSAIPTGPEKLPVVVDQQLIRLLNGEGILCIPLATDQKIIGVLVAGITEQRLPQLRCQQHLISHFANEAARAIQRWQQLLAEQQQLLAIERMRQQEHTSKLLHEAYNPLSIVNNYLQLLAGKLGEDHAAQSQLTILKEEIERVTGILMRMKDLPEAENIVQGEVDLNALIQDLFSIFRTSLFTGHAIHETVTLDRNLPLVLGNRNSLKQIITNLVKNAVEAMPEGGQLRLDTRGQVNVNGELFVELTVADTGQGMANDMIKNLFKPITSTKGKDNAGLGLSIVNKLVSDMRGNISCRSNTNGGTEFRVLLPMKK